MDVDQTQNQQQIVPPVYPQTLEQAYNLLQQQQMQQIQQQQQNPMNQMNQFNNNLNPQHYLGSATPFGHFPSNPFPFPPQISYPLHMPITPSDTAHYPPALSTGYPTYSYYPLPSTSPSSTYPSPASYSPSPSYSSTGSYPSHSSYHHNPPPSLSSSHDSDRYGDLNSS